MEKRNRKQDFIAIVSGAFVWAAAVCIVLLGSSYVAALDPDTYYHIRIADIMASQGLVVKKFLWTTCSIWNEHYFDKDWLFHVYLIPFISLMPAIAGAKTALTLLVFIAGAAWGLLIRELKIRYIFLSMMLVAFVTATAFLGRLALCRGHVVSIMFLPLCILCIIKNRRALLFVLSIIYTLSYTGSWQIIAIAFTYDLIRSSINKKVNILEFTSIWAVAGIAAGMIINPYFPDNLYGGFIQNIMIMKSGLFGMNDFTVSEGGELWPMGLFRMCTIYAPLIIANVFAIIIIINKSDLLKRLHLIFFCVLSIVYLILTLSAIRFTEYYVPVAVIFVLLLAEEFIDSISVKKKIILLSIIYLSTVTSACLSVYKNMMDFKKGTTYMETCEWLNKNIIPDGNKLAPGKIIFTGGWDDAPYLFYGSPQFKYLVMLDPYFMYDYSKTKYRLWQKITDARTWNPGVLIKKEFNSDIIFASRLRKAFQKNLDNCKDVELKFTSRDGDRIYFVK